jgi:hypothetical protein
MKKLILVLTIAMISLSSFSQISSSTKDKDSYTSTDGTVYFVGDKVAIGFPSLPNKAFSYVSVVDKTEQVVMPVIGEKITIEKFYKKSGRIMMVGSSDLKKYLISFDNAIKSGELLSFDMIMKNNDNK